MIEHKHLNLIGWRLMDKYWKMEIVKYLSCTCKGRRVLAKCMCGRSGTGKFYLEDLKKGRVRSCTVCKEDQAKNYVETRYEGNGHLHVGERCGALQVLGDFKGGKTMVTCDLCSPGICQAKEIPRDLARNGMCPTCDADKIKEMSALRKEYSYELASLKNARRRVRREKSYLQRRIWMDSCLHQGEQGDWTFIKLLVQGELGRRPQGYCLGRIDNDKDYEPSNLKWSTRDEESRNRSTVKLYPFKGGQTTLEAFCKEYGQTRKLVGRWLSWGKNLDYIAAILEAQRAGRSTIDVHRQHPWRVLPSHAHEAECYPLKAVKEPQVRVQSTTPECASTVNKETEQVPQAYLRMLPFVLASASQGYVVLERP